MEQIRNVWETKEFREAKKKYKLKNKCEQEGCNSTEKLTPHHLISYKNLILWKLRELAITQLCKEKGITFYPSALIKTGGFSSSSGYIKLRELAIFIKEHPKLKEKARELAREEYYSFSNVQTLCHRCHFATEKGMILCSYCKKKYHYRKFESCYNCKNKVEEEYGKFEEEMDEWD